MTWGNFQRSAAGYIKRSWVVNREVISAIYNGPSKQKVKPSDIFDFGITERMPNDTVNREYMKKRQEHLKNIKNGVRS